MIKKLFRILATSAIIVAACRCASAQDSGPSSRAADDEVFQQLISESSSSLNSQPYLALEHAAQARMIAEQSCDSIMMAKSYKMLGQCYYHTRIYYLAMEMYFKAFEIFAADGMEDMVAQCLVGVAQTYSAQEVPNLAEEYCMKAIDVCRKYDCPETMADALSTLGQVSVSTNEDVAIPNMKKAKAIYDSLGIVGKSIDIDISMARAYTYLDCPDTALNILDQILDAHVINGDKASIARTYLALGDTYFSIREFGKAGTYYKSALKMFRECSLTHETLVCRIRMARMQYHSADYQQALDNALAVLSEAQMEEVQHGTEEIAIKHSACYILYNIHKHLGNTNLAMQYCEQFAQTGDSIYLLKKQEQFSEFQISMETQQKQKEIEVIQKSNENEVLKLEKKAYTRNMISLAVIVLLVISVVIIYYRRYKEKERGNTALAITNQRMEQEIQERKIAESELRYSEEKYRLLFRKTPMGIIQFNDKMIVTAINERLSEIMGLKNKNVAGQDIFSLIPQKAIEGYDMKSDAEGDGKMFKKEVKLNTPAGEVFVSISIKSYLYNSGSDVEKGGIMIVEDITERKKASEHEMIYNAASNNIINILPESVFLLDSKGNYVFARIPGLPVSEQNAYIGKNMRQMLRPDVLLPFLVAFNTVRKTGEEQFAEYQEEDSPDCQQYSEARFVGADDGKVLVVVRDISRQKKAENKLKSAKNTAESGSKAKSEFILGITTEIMQPLESILLNCEQLVAAASPDNEQSQKLKEILTTAIFVNETFSDVLKLTEVEAGNKALTAKTVNPATLAKDVFEIFRSRAAEKKLKYEFEAGSDIPGKLQLDEVRVRQVLFNIISNGIKYTERGSVTLRVSAASQGAEKTKLRFAVSDTGIGLSEMQIANIFSSGNGKSGLTLAKKMVDSLKGTLSVNSEVGKGSEFVFEFPVTRSDADQQKAPPASADARAYPDKSSRKKSTDSMREYISVLKYAVIPEFKNLKGDMSFASLTEFVSKFREQSLHYHIDKGVDIANELLSNIQNYNISSITMNIRRLETYILNSIKELQGE